MPAATMRIGSLLVCCLVLQATTIFAQAIDYVTLIDGVSHPLVQGDNGLRFAYRTNRCGSLSAYLNIGNQAYHLFSNQQEVQGPGEIAVPASKLEQLCADASLSPQQCELELAHIACLTNRHSEKRTPMMLRISAPNGCSFTPEPQRPVLYRTDHTKKRINALSSLTLVAGLVTIASGLVQAWNSGEDKEREKRATTTTVIGAALLALSGGSIYKSIPDKTTNAKNRALNEYMMSKWNRDVQTVRDSNTKVAETFTVRIDFND